jgi:hypothetical protein
MSFVERLRVTRQTITPSDPWTALLRNIRGQIGDDGVERVATDNAGGGKTAQTAHGKSWVDARSLKARHQSWPGARLCSNEKLIPAGIKRDDTIKPLNR